MAKITKDHLKEIVKECLFEILLDATDSGQAIQEGKSTRLNSASQKSRMKKKSSSSSRHHPALDNIRAATPPPKKIDTSGITSDPIMAAIFQDTAETTLREQMDADRGNRVVGGDAASLQASKSDPTELFSESSQNWAALAFNDSSKK